MQRRKLAILGSTGSIGRQTLDVVSQHPDLFEVELLTANNSSDLLIEQAIRFNANCVVIRNEESIGMKQYNNLNSGVYIVRVGDRVFKVRIG